MQLTAQQKSAAQAIVNIFETGSVRGNYADVTLLPGDSGQLTYGRSQTTLASGNLYLLIQDYCGRSDGTLSASFKPYLPQLESCDVALNQDMHFRELLKDAGSDPVMQEVQDAFFDRVYWDPAMRSADAVGAQSALGAAIVYDSTVHGSWAHVRDLTRKQFGELRAIGEEAWMSHYVDTRRNWLATYPNPLLHKTVYRMDAFRAIIGTGNWTLALPFSVRGKTISADTLVDAAPVKVPAEDTPRRQLRLKSPPLTGPDVSWLQQRLTQAGIHVADTGSFDAATDAAVKTFQQAHGIKADGIVGPATRSALEDVPVVHPAATVGADAPMPAVAQPKIASTTPMSAPATNPAPAETSDIKSHVSNEVKAGVAEVQKTIADKHQQLVTLVAPAAAKTAPAAAKPAAAPELPPPNVAELQTILGSLSLSGRPMLAGLSSAVILLFTEARDTIAWVSAGLSNAATSHQLLPPLPPLPQSTGQVGAFLNGAYAYINAAAASLPNEWIFRLHIAAMLLIVYAVYRVRAAHLDLRKLQARVDAARQFADTAKQNVETARQDVAEVRQIVDDVNQIVRIVK